LKSFHEYFLENPRSPLFARIAHEFLQRNDPAGALKVALEGLKVFPDYATGILIAAESHVMLRHFSEARQLLLQLLRTVPACKSAELLLDRIVELELEYPSPLVPPVPDPIPVSPEGDWKPKNREKNWSKADELIPGLGEPAAFTALKSFHASESPPSSDFERLAVKLENARIPLLNDDGQPPFPDMEETDAGAETCPPIHPVTETMAVILREQGKLDAAIDVYRELTDLHPLSKAGFEKKIEELEKLRITGH
jgi:hypothetical protein